MRISEIFDLAAEERLSVVGAPTDDDLADDYGAVSSCSAVWRVMGSLREDCRPATRLLLDAGVSGYPDGQFDEFPAGPERQAVRYCWLKFMAHVAREEGL